MKGLEATRVSGIIIYLQRRQGYSMPPSTPNLALDPTTSGEAAEPDATASNAGGGDPTRIAAQTSPSRAAIGLPDTGFDPPIAPDEIGRLGGYRVLRLLGQGAMGAVYAAQDVKLQRPVALKVMLPEIARRPEARERFLREARAAAAVHDDRVVTIYQVDEANGVPFLAMEYLRGKPLDAWMRDNRPTIPQILKIGYDAALGLAAAHALGLVHRDIKPANLWLEAPNGRIKILDFGLARSAACEDAQLTGSGVILGTPAYMAPEQARGLPVDHRCDLFSLGCVLYHLTTGQRPFTGSDTLAVLTSLAVDTPTAPHERNPDVPPALSDLVMRLLAKRPEDRPGSAREVAEELRHVQREMTGGPVPMAAPVDDAQFPETPAVTVWEQIDVSAQMSAANGEVVPAKRKAAMWPTYAGLGLLVVLTGLLAVGVLKLMRFGDKPVAKAPDDLEPPKPPTPKKTVPGKVVPFSPLDPEWEKRTLALPPPERVREVLAEIKRRNPTSTFDVTQLLGSFQYVGNRITLLHLHLPGATDILPLRVFPDLETFAMYGDPKIPVEVASLAALKKLRHLGINDVHVRDLSPLAALTELESLGGSFTYDDLTPLKSLRIKIFELRRGDLEQRLPLVCEWWPLEELTIEGVGKPIDLTPLRKLKSFRQLTVLSAGGSDLTPLAGSTIESLQLQHGVYDLTPLKKLPSLNEVIVANCPSVDLAPLAGTTVTKLTIDHIGKPVELARSRGLGIKILGIGEVTYTDPAVLADWPLEQFHHSLPEGILAGLVSVLRGHKTLKSINLKPVAEFWKEYDAKKP